MSEDKTIWIDGKYKLADFENHYIEQLEAIGNDNDHEVTHAEADRVLCDLLKELGFLRVVDAWDEIVRWYA